MSLVEGAEVRKSRRKVVFHHPRQPRDANTVTQHLSAAPIALDSKEKSTPVPQQHFRDIASAPTQNENSSVSHVEMTQRSETMQNSEESLGGFFSWFKWCNLDFRMDTEAHPSFFSDESEGEDYRTKQDLATAAHDDSDDLRINMDIPEVDMGEKQVHKKDPVQGGRPKSQIATDFTNLDATLSPDVPFEPTIPKAKKKVRKVKTKDGTAKEAKKKKRASMCDAETMTEMQEKENDLLPHHCSVLVAPLDGESKKVEQISIGIQVERQQKAFRSKASQTEDMSRSLYLFSTDNSFRRKARSIVYSRVFIQIILFCIFGSAVSLMLMDPLQPNNSHRNRVFFLIELACSLMFVVEMLLKIIAEGFLLDEKAYLRGGWNCIDFTCVLSSLTVFIPSVNSLRALKVVRAVRVIRPLSAIRRYENLNLLLNSIVQSTAQFLNMILIILLFVSIMGVIGVELFQGRFQQACLNVEGPGFSHQHLSRSVTAELEDARLCTMPSQSSAHECQPETQMCVETGVNPNHGVTSFDNILVGSLAVFQSITLEGWTDILYFIMDSYKNWVGVVFMAVVVVIGGLLVMNLALAVVYTSYLRQKKTLIERIRKQAEAQRALEEFQERERLREEKLAYLMDNDASVGGIVAESYHDIHRLQTQHTFQKKAFSFKPANAVSGHQQSVQSVYSEEEQPPSSGHWCARLFPSGCSGLSEFCKSGAFEWGILGIIVVNVFFLALYHYNAPPRLVLLIDRVNMVCNFIFFVEFGLKLTALGPREYFQDAFNIFDFMVLLLSVLELLATFNLLLPARSVEGALALRALRVTRVFKLGRRWKELQDFLSTMVQVGQSGGSFFFLMMMFLVIFALMGEQLFAGHLEDARFHFDNMAWAFITSFQVMTGENWNDGMYVGVDAIGWGAAVYYLLLFLVGNTFLLNLFISILIDKCMEKKSEEKNPSGESSNTLPEFRVNSVSEYMGFSPSANVLPSIRSIASDLESTAKIVAEQVRVRSQDSIYSKLSVEVPEAPVEEGMFSGPLTLDQLKPRRIEKWKSRKRLWQGNLEAQFNMRSDWWLNVRKFLGREVVFKAWFEWLILVIILLSTILLAIDNPNKDFDSKWETVMFGTNVTFAILFLMEMIVKVIVFGVWKEEGAYFRDAWNVLDAAVLVFSFLSLAVPQLLFLRALRACRALRIISRHPGLKLVVSSLLVAIRKSAHVFVVGMIFVITCSIMGVHLFAGTFAFCNGHPEIDRKEDCQGTLTNVLNGTTTEENLHWIETRRNFNSVFNGALVIFELCSMEMWPEIMLLGVDSSGYDRGMKEGARPWMVLYFIPVMALLAFCYINLFVGIVIEVYNSIKTSNENQDLSHILLEWIKVKKQTDVQVPYMAAKTHKNFVRQWFLNIVKSKYFNPFFLGMIVLNIAILMLQHFRQPDELTSFVMFSSAAFTFIFIVEFVLKLVGLGLRRYFFDMWNLLDFFLVLITTFEYVIQDDNVRWIRLMRFFRIAHLARNVPTVGIMLQAMRYGLPQIGSVLSVTFIIFYMYAVVGMNLFGGMDTTNKIFFSSRVNFYNFGNSMLTLSRAATGESYNGIMYEMMDCKEEGCEFHHAAAPFMVSFVIITQFLLMNIIVAVIIDAYGECLQNQRIDPILLEKFCRLWHKGDPRGCGYLPLARLHTLLIGLDAPLGFSRTQQHLTTCQLVPMVSRLNLALFGFKDEDKIQYMFGSEFLASLIPRKRTNILSESETPPESNIESRASTPSWRDKKSSPPNVEEVQCICVEFQDVLQALCARALLMSPEFKKVEPQDWEQVHNRLVKEKVARIEGLQMVFSPQKQEQEDLESQNGFAELVKGVMNVNRLWAEIGKAFTDVSVLARVKPDFVFGDYSAADWLAVCAIELQWSTTIVRRKFFSTVSEAHKRRNLAAHNVVLEVDHTKSFLKEWDEPNVSR